MVNYATGSVVDTRWVCSRVGVLQYILSCVMSYLGWALWGRRRSRREDPGLQFLSRAQHRGVRAARHRSFVYANQHGQLSDGLQVQRGTALTITFRFRWLKFTSKIKCSITFCSIFIYLFFKMFIFQLQLKHSIAAGEINQLKEKV